jgi:arylformamidase
VKIWDISPLVSPATAVFPGDVPFSREVSMDLAQGQHLTLSSIRTTLHVGAHADSSSHYDANGEGVEKRPLSCFLGGCQVIRVNIPRGARIQPADLGGEKILRARVLFHTGSFPDPDRWNGDFNSLSPELVDYLADRGVVTVGIDTPSVDPADSKALESHKALYRRNLAVLEGIILSQVKPGLYTMIALPLKLKDADASPVRAILMEPNLLE